MANHVARTVSAVAAAGVLLTSVVMAVASLPRDGGAPTQPPSFGEPVRGLTMAPVSGEQLFHAKDACVGTEEALWQLDAERAQIGGETVVLDQGLDQAFADTWRRHADQPSVAISTVMAHVVGEDENGIVDVIEFDQAGCALTRTVLSVGDWAYLLRQSIETGV